MTATNIWIVSVCVLCGPDRQPLRSSCPVEEMFEGGWIHRNKQRDPVYNICAINFPDSLMQPYNTYKCVSLAPYVV